MKTTQKLELCLGIATPIATLIYIYFGFFRVVFLSTKFPSEINSSIIGAGILFALIFFFSLMVAVGAYFNAKGSDIAIDILYIGCFVIIVFLGSWGFFVLAFWGLYYGLLVYSPVILSTATLLLTLLSKEKSVLTIK